MESSIQHLVLKGVRQNNLKNIDLDIPLGKSVVITGPSGSGKSSLAFETIYAEGQRRYMQSLSTYARQFLEKFRAPIADQILHIPPTIALEQINPVRNSRATVGTTTEINDYLRLLFEKIGIEYCEKCNVPMERLSFEMMHEKIQQKYAGSSILITFHKKLEGASSQFGEILQELLRTGYTRLLVKQEVKLIEEILKGKKHPKDFYVIVDRLKLEKRLPSEANNRFNESLRQAMHLGIGFGQVFVEKGPEWEEVEEFTRDSRCPKCKTVSAPKSSISFSFNSPLGACQTCKGFGNTLEVDEDLVVPNPQLSLAEGAIDPFTKPSLKHWQKNLLHFCKEARLDADLPYKDLPAAHRKLIFEGEKRFKGVRGLFKILDEEKYKMRIRVFVSRYVSPFTCKQCQGARLNPSSLRVRIGGKNIAEIANLPLQEILAFTKTLSLSKRERAISEDVLTQLERRLDTLTTVGLGYITISRLTKTLSGGEYQRILLSTQLSQGLTDTMYVLDEPSIGLHPRDTQKLLQVLNRLRSLGNSVILVEHDPEVIEWGEYLVDMGPGSGMRGGSVMFSGSKDRFLLSQTQTAKSIATWKEECRHALLRPLPRRDEFLEIKGAAGNNLKDVNVQIPLKCLVGITGVSGSGKSTLIVDTLFQALSKIFHGQSDKISKFESISGFDNLGAVELVDQTPIGKSTRSNPITFIKGYDEVRSLFANTPEATAKRFTPGHFSFNVSGGRCEACEGEGRVKVDMVFMEDISVPCQVCDEKRFKPSVLAIRYRGKNIDDVLHMTVDEAYDFFKTVPSLRTKLSLLHEVGLGYLQLGQPGFTLSGGEAQRLKIARELATGSVKRPPTLFILDEPTTGLHFVEITKLLIVLKRLIAAGHSVVVIEHNLQFICACDYLIDLGPDGGDDGGKVVAVGSPKEVAAQKASYTGTHLAEIFRS